METITVRGKTFSVETVVEALQKHCNFEEEKPYVFQAGDVAIAPHYSNALRIICKDNKGGIMSVNIDGYVQSQSQSNFESNGYKKIGRLSDFIKRDC